MTGDSGTSNPRTKGTVTHPSANEIDEIRYEFFAGLSSGTFPGQYFRLTLRSDGGAHYDGDALPNLAVGELADDVFSKLARRFRRMRFFDLEDTYDEILTMTLDGGWDRYRVRAGDQFKEIYVNQEQTVEALNRLGCDLYTLTKSLSWRPGPPLSDDEASIAWDAQRKVDEPGLLAERRARVLREAGLGPGWTLHESGW
ncbi:MAG: hypothetical protein QOK05_604 [Chloroflexota bacterium]|nr:hypothetical protein [Chloroflexota bacterium]